MSDQTENLAAILADFRKFALRAAEEDKTISPESVLLLADKVEAAAERERDEDRQLAAIAESDEAFARCARCDRPERATGNAAALREALENVERVARFCAEAPRHTPAYPTDAARADVLYSRIAELGRVARAALSAPPRNCDRFATAEEAYAAWQKHKSLTAICDWLFATAEGGKK
jgi:hypothetical protein